MKGLTTPLSRWLQVCVCLCRYSVACCVVSYWIDSLFLKTEGNTYATLLHHPFLFKRKTNACSRGSKKDLWRHYRGDLRQAKTYQVPIINSHPLHYIIRHLPLIFLSPTSKTIFENLCLFIFPSFVRCYVCLCSHVRSILLASLLAKNLLIWIHSKFSTWIIFDPYVLVLKPQLV
mgnify:CR=1 FL=1